MSQIVKPSVEIFPDAVITRGRLFATLKGDHPTRPELIAGKTITSSTVLSGSVEQGMVETRNTIYVIQQENQ